MNKKNFVLVLAFFYYIHRGLFIGPDLYLYKGFKRPDNEFCIKKLCETPEQLCNEALFMFIGQTKQPDS